MKYVHTNIVARNWRLLADFYIKVFGCEPVPPERDLRGDWIDKAVNLSDTHITGVHLRLPGYKNGPTLEVFQYEDEPESKMVYPNTPGLCHLAFRVDDVLETADRIVEMGGDWLGQLTEVEIKGVGGLVFAYMRDPEGNIIEIQRQET